MRSLSLLLLLLLSLMLLAGCAAGPNPNEGEPRTEDEITAAPTDEELAEEPEEPKPAGFWLGLWHGAIVWIAFFISLFNDSVTIYEVHNNGGWYNLGFLLGAGAVMGGGGSSACRSKK